MNRHQLMDFRDFFVAETMAWQRKPTEDNIITDRDIWTGNRPNVIKKITEKFNLLQGERLTARQLEAGIEQLRGRQLLLPRFVAVENVYWISGDEDRFKNFTKIQLRKFSDVIKKAMRVSTKKETVLDVVQAHLLSADVKQLSPRGTTQPEVKLRDNVIKLIKHLGFEEDLNQKIVSPKRG